MANPRDTVAFDEIRAPGDTATYLIDESTITFDADEENGSAQVGLAVKLSDDKTIALATDGSAVIGKLLLVERDGKATVQTGGYMKLPSGAGAALTNGKKIVGDLDGANAGYIREVATGTAAELGVARGFIVDNSDTAAVVVHL
jgi:hypothetical protein